MKTFLITDPAIGIASQFMAQQALQQAVSGSEFSLATTLAEAELVVVLGAAPDYGLQGKKVWISSIETWITEATSLLVTASQQAQLWQQPQAGEPQASATEATNVPFIVAVTACPTGVAHTFMAAEAIQAEAAKRGWQVRVETRGSVGAGTPITADEVAAADLVLIAADIEVDLGKFVGKPMYRTSTSLALKKTGQEFDKALQQAKPYQPAGSSQARGSNQMAKDREKSGAYRHLLTGVSYMLPMVVAGGLCIALSFMFGIHAFEQPATLAAALKHIGGDAAFALMIPVLAGFIAFSIADRPGLTPGLIGGMLANSANAGFIGGIIAGFIAGYIARLISNKLRLPSSMEALKPILIIPLLASLVTGLLMIYVVGTPVSRIMLWLTQWLGAMGTGNAVLLGAILGGMMCTDMGGPVNKVAYAFGVGVLSTQIYTPMAAIMAGGMVPPLAMGIATLLARRKFNRSEQDAGKAAMVLGLCFISEGAIPFAARDPIRVLPCCIIGGAITGAISMAIGAKLMAPHGGLFVMLIPGAITPVLGYLFAIVAGSVVSGVSYALLRPSELK